MGPSRFWTKSVVRAGAARAKPPNVRREVMATCVPVNDALPWPWTVSSVLTSLICILKDLTNYMTLVGNVRCFRVEGGPRTAGESDDGRLTLKVISREEAARQVFIDYGWVVENAAIQSCLSCSMQCSFSRNKLCLLALLLSQHFLSLCIILVAIFFMSYFMRE